MKLYYFVDHTSRFARCSGVPRVVRGLARALLESGCDVIFVAWDPARKTLIRVDQGMLNNLASFQGPMLDAGVRSTYPDRIDAAVPLHECPFAPARTGDWLLVPEVTHITPHAQQPTQDLMGYCARHGLKTSFIFYDAIPLKHADYSATEAAHTEYMQQLALADLLIPISRFSADDLISFYLNRLYFQMETLPSISPVPLPSEMTNRPRRMPVDSEKKPKLILSVGTIESRKNQLGLLSAFKKFCDRNPDVEVKLMLIGGLLPSVGGEVLEAIRSNPHVKLLEYADDNELNKYYAECDFTVFPSIEEGYGLPIVESLWHGKPCICANFGSMGEIAEGGGCLTVDTRSVDELLAAISQLLLQPAALSQLKEELKQREFTTWSGYAEQVKQLIVNADAPSAHIRKIYYWVDHTCDYPSNSGIQRVVRSLAASLQKTGIPMVPVRWDAEREEFTLPSEADLEHLEKWNGPRPDRWELSLPVEDESGAWLLVPELPTYEDAPPVHSVLAYTKKKNMRAGIVFYDAIPYKMTEIYPEEIRHTHAEYMRTLALFDRVLCISEQSRTDLLNYLNAHLDRLVNVEQRIKTILLPAEFPQIERQSAHKSAAPGAPISILSVGTLEARKNHVSLLEAFERAKSLTGVPLKLILAGQAPFPDIAETVKAYCGKDADITWIGHPDDRILGELYRACDFTVYPSLEEGFGLPILESLWHARPCICRNAGSMREIGEGGGCVLVETARPEELAKAIANLSEDAGLLYKLGEEAVNRKFKTWQEYGQDVLQALAERSEWRTRDYPPVDVAPSRSAFHAPILSICISTYNRAPWLALSLPLLLRQTAPYRDVLEVVVCDNASTDDTEKVVEPHLEEPGFRYIRNPANVGMLGNLKVTAQHAKGQYVWILGDDDLLVHGTVERVMKAMLEHPDISLIYLNYGYTTIADAGKIGDIERFLDSGVPICPPGPDVYAPISRLATLSENFFTAIYCLVFRRDHALLAYSQNTEGRPFSSMLTSIPTSHYVCRHMMSEAGYWIGEPGLIVNMNVSWGRYASLWVLERLPELYDLAELNGASQSEVDRWRAHNLPGALNYLREIYFSDAENNIRYFSIERFIARYKHVLKLAGGLQELMAVYEEAHQAGHPAAQLAPAELLARFGLSRE